MRIAIITDTHWGARSDSREFLDYFIRFYNEIFFPEIENRGVTKILHLGDIVDRRKYINFVTLRALREHFMNRALAMGIDIHAIVGNHDVPFRNTNEINALRETFSTQPNLHLYSDPTELEFDGCNILLMPWINSGNYHQCMDVVKNTRSQIMFGHLEIKGFEMHRGIASHEGFDASTFDKFDIVASGHFHRKSTRGNIHYLGAPYEMTWNDYDDSRGFHIFDTDTREFEYIINPLRMFHKVWYNDEDKTFDDMNNHDFSHLKDTYVKVIVQSKTNPYWFDLWLNKIYDVQPIDVDIVEDHGHQDILSEEDIISSAEDTMTILQSYVKNLETGINKNELNKLMRSLYEESISMETDVA